MFRQLGELASNPRLRGFLGMTGVEAIRIEGVTLGAESEQRAPAAARGRIPELAAMA